jgi:hypothetical protein
LEWFITQDIESTEVFCGICIFCGFFTVKDFLSYRPSKIVWADLPMARKVRVRCEPGEVLHNGVWKL